MLFKVLAVLVCMVLVISKIAVNWGDAFRGFIPSKALFGSGSLYTCMYSLFLRMITHCCFSRGGPGCHRHAAQPLPWISPRNTGPISKRLRNGFTKIPRDFTFASNDIITARASINTFRIQLEKTVQYVPLR